MGKLKDLLDEFKITQIHSPRDSEIREEIKRIVSWMESQNMLTKPFKLPKKYMKHYLPFLFVDLTGKPQGLYCGCCANNVTLEQKNCLKCGMGLGAVVYHG
jgi:hypothetical protein